MSQSFAAHDTPSCMVSAEAVARQDKLISALSEIECVIGLTTPLDAVPETCLIKLLSRRSEDALSKWIGPASLTAQATGMSVRPEKTVVRRLIAGNLSTLSQVFKATNGSVSERSVEWSEARVSLASVVGISDTLLLSGSPFGAPQALISVFQRNMSE